MVKAPLEAAVLLIVWPKESRPVADAWKVRLPVPTAW